MRTILAIAAVSLLVACSSPHDVEAEMISAQLIKIDTAFQYSDIPKQMLTWRDENNISYVTYVSMQNSFALGSRMIVLVKR